MGEPSLPRFKAEPVEGGTANVHASLANSPCEQLGMDGGGRCGSVSAADERPQQPHFAH